jgi:hypothetical protein
MKRTVWAAAFAIAGLMALPAYSQVFINEIRIDQPGTDNDEYFELVGPPGLSLGGLTYLVIGDSSTDSCGVIEAVVSLAGREIPADGHFLCVKQSFTLAPLSSADLVLSSLNFENGDNVTHLLVSGFTGSNGQNLDLDDDGRLDVTPWSQIVDSVALLAGPPVSSDCTYSPEVLGPDPANPGNPPWHVYRCLTGSGDWRIGAFIPAGGQDTPGSPNLEPPAITAHPSGQTACTGSRVTFSVEASGAGALAYEWRRDGAPIEGASAASLTIEPLTPADEGTYDVVVSNECGSITSDGAILVVLTLPSILVPPASARTCAGAPVTFTVIATGGPLSYRWRKDGVEIPGATGSSYSIPAAAAEHAGIYDVRVSNECGSVTSDGAAFVVDASPRIVSPPQSTVGCAGTAATFEVQAEGEGLRYQWRRDGVDLPDATTSVLVIAPLSASDAGSYEVLVSNECGTVASGSARLDVAESPVIAGDPSGGRACEGDSVTLAVIVEGGPLPIRYQWRRDGIEIPGEQNASLVIEAVSAADAGSYDVFVSNDCGSVVSRAASLTVGAATAIAKHPSSQSLFAGSTAVFRVVAAGESLQYRWRRGGEDLEGAIADVLVLAAISPADAGTYDVVVSGTCGTLESEPAVLNVLPVPAVSINEVRLDPISPYFELAGAPGGTLDGTTYVIVGSASGAIDAVIDLTGNRLPADGHFLAVSAAGAAECAAGADLLLAGGVAFESDSQHFLVAGFGGSAGQVLDLDGDGRLDVAAWLVEIDHVAMTGGAHAYRCPDSIGDWQRGEADASCAGLESPGAGNPPCILAGPRDQVVCEGEPVHFAVTAAGTPPVTIQWKHDGDGIPGATGDGYGIGFARLEDAGVYTACVSDSFGTVTSPPANLTVEPFFTLRTGSVNAAAGSVTDVLFVNGEAGSDCERIIDLGADEPFEMRIVTPPAALPGSARYAVFVWRGEPAKSTIEVLPQGIGSIAMPTPLTGRSPQPERVANNLAAAFGPENWPIGFRPTRPAPYVLFRRPSGLGMLGSLYIQGIIVDPASPSGRFAVTNGILLRLR